VGTTGRIPTGHVPTTTRYDVPLVATSFSTHPCTEPVPTLIVGISIVPSYVNIDLLLRQVLLPVCRSIRTVVAAAAVVAMVVVVPFVIPWIPIVMIVERRSSRCRILRVAVVVPIVFPPATVTGRRRTTMVVVVDVVVAVTIVIIIDLLPPTSSSSSLRLKLCLLPTILVMVVPRIKDVVPTPTIITVVVVS
jgi:hypothetical protein